MIIIIEDSKKEKITCNLTVKKDLTRARRHITNKVSRKEISTLKKINAQLKKNMVEARNLLGNDSQGNNYLDKIINAIKEINELPSIIIKSERGKKYNLNNLEEHRKLTARIKEYGKQKKLNVLKNLQNQVEEALSVNRKTQEISQIQKLITALIEELERPATHLPYTELLKQEFNIKRPGIKKQDKDPEHYNSKNEQNNYLNRSVTTKKKRGQDSINQLASCFWLDFMKNTGFLSADMDRKHVIFYLVLIRNFFSHNASYYPAQGYGKASEAECAKPLFYVRSQTKHHELSLYKYLKKGITTYGKQNKAYLSMLKACNTMVSKDCQALAERIHSTGQIEHKINGERLGEKLAHLATRASNLTLFHQLLEHAYDYSLKDDGNQLKTLIPSLAIKENIFSKFHLEQRIIEIRKSFKKLNNINKTYFPNIMTVIMQARNKTAYYLRKKCEESNLKLLKLETPKHSGFVYLTFYPDFNNQDLKNSDNMKQGLTNVLIGFYGALVNYYAKKQGLHYYLARRQSFGFLRAAITDTGSLRMRLSLGANPEPFQKIHLQAIRDMDSLLAQFNFIYPDKSVDDTIKILIKNCLKPSEGTKSQKGKISNKTGNHLRHAMREEDSQWIALLVGQKYLEESNGDTPTSFKKYLTDFIYERAKKKKISEGENKKLSRHGHSFANKNTIKLDPPQQENKATIIERHPILQLLFNLTKSTISYVNQLEELEISASMHHVLFKLLRNCQKGTAILNHVQKYEISHILAKANVVIENIQEYLMPLRVLAKDIDSSSVKLQQLERNRFATIFNRDLTDCHVFYNDGGLQAINTAIMTMGFEGMKTVYLFHDCYYEINSFCNDAGIEQRNKDHASIWLCDITQSEKLIKDISDTLKNKPRAIIIDITNDSTTLALQALDPIVKFARENRVWLTLSCSTLKHEQLGQDKYQSGRNIIFPPSDKNLSSRTSLKHLEAISASAMHGLFTSFRQTIETVTQRKECTTLLKTHGLFSTKPSIAIEAPQIRTSANDHLKNRRK